MLVDLALELRRPVNICFEAAVIFAKMARLWFVELRGLSVLAVVACSLCVEEGFFDSQLKICPRDCAFNDFASMYGWVGSPDYKSRRCSNPI